MVDHKMLKIPFYRTKIVQDSTGRAAKNVKQVEIQPLEWTAQLVFSDGIHKQGVPLPINNILYFDVTSETKGMIRKKEDLMVKITFKGTDNLEYWIIIDLEDKYVQEFLENLRVLGCYSGCKRLT